MHSQLVVLGGGPGGYAAAFLAADLGFSVTIVEADQKLGGVCLLRGCIPSKALLHVAKVIADAQHAGEWGVSFPKPAIDVNAMRARKQKVLDTLAGGLKMVAGKRKVQVLSAKGTFLNSGTLALESTGPEPLPDTTLTFDHCIVATGSSPTKIPAFDIGTDRVMDSTGALELRDIPESLLVVGGGYIGLEMGSVYAALGTKVYVVELLDGLLMGADRDLVKPLQKRIEKEFAGIYLGTKVVSMADKGDSVEVTFDGPVAEKVQRFSRVLVSIGRRPNSKGFGLENTRVIVDPKGFIVTNDRQQTADPKILAIGDVAGEPMLAHKAAHQGKVAVEALHGEPVTFNPRAIPAVVFTDPEIAWAGLTESEAKASGRNVEVSLFPWAASGRAQAVGRTEGLTKLIIDPNTERILGMGLVGPHVGDMIAEGVMAIEMGATVRDFMASIHPHPTFSETMAFTAEVFLGQATDLYKPRREKKT
jgi:dihydrolipoamide dehydrogenase